MIKFNNNGKDYIIESIINGKMNGLVQIFENNIKISEFHMKEGILHGHFTQYNPQTKKIISGNFIDGKKEGAFNFEDDIVFFENNIPSGEFYSKFRQQEYLFDVKDGVTNNGIYNRIYLYFKLKYINFKKKLFK
ncbi:hypothetical protein AB836_01480 [Rickettsiales bacterium (ex Bugula neritina AB1)]|nr:hypothetical protein AB836_01480 [Rickettsiales bacterium (ex Bugula neritina AB1)]